MPPDPATQQLTDLASHLLARRDAILTAWRDAGAENSERSIGSSLSRAQFNDHIPAVLDCLGATIRAGGDRHHAGPDLTASVCEHGLQRWQQGY
ncbi:MAG TPA: sensor histidine kinase, partial [Thermoanaerobaculia bacterium]|nr:sensor histidine kinase [Thermoanaerobaculia bacterium]